ncbi:hypothetical protein EYC80_007123 [Monilinia laxa]|uniref:Uncharacterized protein n=1 Tax=Monilinia laxa TaxID=61186 RepID=A0A5N6K0A4_MONLA|nr:hypothetical protein EYC80_007123 [Monilinia laxa]
MYQLKRKSPSEHHYEHRNIKRSYQLITDSSKFFKTCDLFTLSFEVNIVHPSCKEDETHIYYDSFTMVGLLRSDRGAFCSLPLSTADNPTRQLKANKSSCDDEDHAEDNNDTRLSSCPVLSLDKILCSFANLDSCHFDRLLQSIQLATCSRFIV